VRVTKSVLDPLPPAPYPGATTLLAARGGFKQPHALIRYQGLPSKPFSRRAWFSAVRGAQNCVTHPVVSLSESSTDCICHDGAAAS
jgi:hypothetical protein